MNKEKFNNLKMKFTDGNGKYIFSVPVMEMTKEDLRDYIDYMAERYAKAVYYVDVNMSFKAVSDANNKQQKYAHILKLVKINRPDIILTENEKQIACFG